MVSSWRKNYKSNLPSSLCVVLANIRGPARHDVTGRNDALPQPGLWLCLFCLKTLQDLGRVHEYVKHLQGCALAILSNSDLLNILNLGMICISGSSLRNEDFTHFQSI